MGTETIHMDREEALEMIDALRDELEDAMERVTRFRVTVRHAIVMGQGFGEDVSKKELDRIIEMLEARMKNDDHLRTQQEAEVKN